MGVAIIVTFVEDPATTVAARATPTLRSLIVLVRDARFAPLLLITAILGVVTISDAFLYVVMQRRAALAIGIVPLLFVASSLVYASLAAPVGRIADRLGRERVFVGGYALLPLLYAVMLVSDGPVTVLVGVVMLGAYYAATDGVLMALAAPRVDASLRSSGLALLTTVTAIARLTASIMFGAAWTLVSAEAAVAAFTVAMIIALAISMRVFARLSTVDHALA
jgi:MFS family permease